jgi:hypothetical protein
LDLEAPKIAGDKLIDLKVLEEMEEAWKHTCKCDKCHRDKCHCHWEFVKCKECQKECHRCDREEDRRCDRQRCDHCRHDKCKICKCIDRLHKDKVVVCKEEVKVEVTNMTQACTPIDSVENFSFSENINLANWTSRASNEYKIHEILYTDTQFGYPLDNSYQHWKHFYSAAFHFAHQDSHAHKGIEASLSQYVSVCPNTKYKFTIQYHWHSHRGRYDGHGCEVKLTLGSKDDGKVYPWTNSHCLYPDKWNQLESNYYVTGGNETFTKIDIKVKCRSSCYYQANIDSTFPHNKPISWVDTVHLVPIASP